jgi:UDP-N-acetylmuramate dehydrogenase
VESVTHLSLEGALRRCTQAQLRFAYRYAAVEPGILVDVTFQFPRAAPELAAERIQCALEARNGSQDLRVPSAGCAFKNPPGLGAGRLIDQANLKGTRIGDAQISSRHANFIVNLGQATCDDVLSLMEHVQRRVRQTFGVLLEPEVRLIGEQWGGSG